VVARSYQATGLSCVFTDCALLTIASFGEIVQEAAHANRLNGVDTPT
jgi:hypothetical protein